MKKYFAETLGTFCRVFAGTGAIVMNDTSGGKVTYVGRQLVDVWIYFSVPVLGSAIGVLCSRVTA